MSRWKAWIPAVAWAVLIFFLSTDRFSSAHTSQTVSPLLRWLLPHASDATLEAVHIFVRKCAHVAEYFVFGLLLLHALRTPQSGWNTRWALLAILLAGLYACSDEFHQIFVPSRGPSLWDVLIDTAAASAAQLAAWMWMKRKARQAEIKRPALR